MQIHNTSTTIIQLFAWLVIIDSIVCSYIKSYKPESLSSKTQTIWLLLFFQGTIIILLLLIFAYQFCVSRMFCSFAVV